MSLELQNNQLEGAKSPQTNMYYRGGMGEAGGTVEKAYYYVEAQVFRRVWV